MGGVSVWGGVCGVHCVDERMGGVSVCEGVECVGECMGGVSVCVCG